MRRRSLRTVSSGTGRGCAVPAAHPAASVHTASCESVFFSTRLTREVFALQKNTVRSGKGVFAVETITLLAMLTACQVVLGNLFQVPLLGKQYNFGFLPIALAGALLGPVGSMIVGGLGDLVGAHLFPAGAYFPGFTLTNVLVGLVCGLVLHRRRPDWIRAAVAVTVSLAVINLLLNSLWLHMLAYVPDRGYLAWVGVRAPNYLVEVPVNTVLLYLMLRALQRVKLPAAMQLKS